MDRLGVIRARLIWWLKPRLEGLAMWLINWSESRELLVESERLLAAAKHSISAARAYRNWVSEPRPAQPSESYIAAEIKSAADVLGVVIGDLGVLRYTRGDRAKLECLRIDDLIMGLYPPREEVI